MTNAVVDTLERGRESYVRRAWADCYESLTHADQSAPLAAPDLELLATSAYMLARDDDWLRAMERAHHEHLDTGAAQRAVRCAFWLGLTSLAGGEMARATGWFGRGRRLLERDGRDCVERGYLLIATLLQQVADGDHEAALATASEATAIGERFHDADLLAMAMHEQGHALVRQGRAEEGLSLMDETMVAAVAGELSPIVTGIVYCNVIAFCQSVYEVRRAREWTDALTRWCEQQPDMVTHTGLCLVHRAEIMELGGAWADALREARRAGERLAKARSGGLAAGEALYLQGDVHRLQGDIVAAEAAYRDAGRNGREPQPGLSLLRLAQGSAPAAAVAISRATGETNERLERARLLPAYVEIMLAVGELGNARVACEELEEIATRQASRVLGAMSAHARGALRLAEGDAASALVALRRSWQVWQELEAPYEAARVRMRVGLACRALGDAENGAAELEAARDVLARLGAAPDLAHVDSLLASPPPDRHGLSPRELQVLRLVAAGTTNKAIAAELVLSKRTVDRHLSNIFAKLSVSSRSAATAFAYEHELV